MDRIECCKKCIHSVVCENVTLRLAAFEHGTCMCFSDVNNNMRIPCKLGDEIYFIGYGEVETLSVIKINIEISESSKETFGYVDARRSDGTTECIGFNAFGTAAFMSRDKAVNSLEVDK